MNQRLARSLISAAACGCIALPALAQQEPPNLIFILTDDMGLEAIQWPGDEGNRHPRIFTTNLNAMAQQGVSFRRCRVNPNCSPTRACLMTGRSALDNGVVGVIGRYNPLDEPGNPCESVPLDGPPAYVTNRLAMQTQERTIAEVLQQMGYYTILIDKWHLGYNEAGEQRGQRPYNPDPPYLDQGFDVFVDWMDDICDGYGQPGYFFADHHMLRAMQAARDAVNNRPDPEQPYALFFHTITPHKRHPDGPDPVGLGWWEIEDEENLLFYTKDSNGYLDNRIDRFAQNVEALDTALLKYLLRQGNGGLGVLDAETAEYIPQSNTIIFFIGDNGIDESLNQRAKNTLFEGGVRVPCFVMGAGITGNFQYEGTIDDRQISHVDFYDTICDIVQAPPAVRDNEYGFFPRRGESFAYNIGYSQIEGARDVTACSLGNVPNQSDDQIWRVALIHRPEGGQDDRFKLVCASGGAGLDDLSADEFYDLEDDPTEQVNLAEYGMTYEQLAAYYDLRDRIRDEWPTAVSAAPVPETIPTYWAEYGSGDYLLMVYVVEYELQAYTEDKFYNIQADPDREHNLLDGWMTPEEEQIYAAMRFDVQQMWTFGQRIIPDPDLRVVDIPAVATLVSANPGFLTPPPGLTVGHKDSGGPNDREYRVFLKFEVDDGDIPFPTGFGYGDVASAELIVHFKHDSQEFNPNFPETNDYMSRDSDTGVINVFKMLGPWSVNPWVNFDSETSLGQFDPPAHIIAIPFDSGYATKIRMTPMPQGTPVSFGNSLLLKSVIDGWRATPASNHGVVLIAEELPLFLTGTSFRDQQVTFQTTDAVIRLRLERQ